MKTVSVLVTLIAIITPFVSANLRGHRETQEVFDLRSIALKLFTDLNGGMPLDNILQKLHMHSHNVG